MGNYISSDSTGKSNQLDVPDSTEKSSVPPVSVENAVFCMLPIADKKRLGMLKVCICMDRSGSMNGSFSSTMDAEKIKPISSKPTTIMDVQKKFVSELSKMFNMPPSLIEWDNKAQLVTSTETVTPRGGTYPSCIFQNGQTCGAIKESDVMVLLTDGEIDVGEIQHFGKCMIEQGTHLKAIIGVIIGPPKASPAQVNISVLVPAMLSNGCILWHDGKKNYVLWSSGIFRTEWKPVDIELWTQWRDVTTVSPEQMNILVPIPDGSQERCFTQKGYIPFGAGLFFHPEKLLGSSPSWEQLLEMPFDRICQYFRVTQRYGELLEWFKLQKDRFMAEFSIDATDRQKVDQMIYEIQNLSHCANRRTIAAVSPYVILRNNTICQQYADVDDMTFADPRIVQLMKFFRSMMQVMDEDNRTQYQSSGYTTVVSSPSRYTAYSAVPRMSIETMALDFTKPFGWFRKYSRLFPSHGSTKFECTICYEEDVPFVLVRKRFRTDTIEELCNNPSNFFYPQTVCSKCAEYFCIQKLDPVRQPCVAAIPLVNLLDNYRATFMDDFLNLVDRSFFANPNAKHLVIDLFFTKLQEFHQDNPQLVEMVKKLADTLKLTHA